MMARLVSTVRFLSALVRDVGGTLRNRWRRFHSRVVDGQEIAAVAVDVFPFLEQKTGVGWYEWNVLKALDERDDGLQYNLYAETFPGPSDPVPVELPGNRNMRLRVHPIPSHFLFPIRPTRRVLTAVVEPLLRILDDNDVVFAPNYYAHANQAPYGRALVATVHDLTFTVMPDAVAPATCDELRRNMPAVQYHADRLIAVSAATASDLVEHLAINQRRIHVVHEGRDPSFRVGPRSESRPEDLPARYLLFVSTIEPRKNVVGLLRAFRLVVDWGYEGDLLMVGRWGWRTDAIRSELEASPVRERIRHIDYVDRTCLMRLYRHADALLYPSWLEGFGLPILEAMACGTPVVTSGQSSMPEVAGPAAVYVDPASPHGIASAVASLVADAPNRERLTRMGYERVERFSWDRTAAATAQTLRQAGGLPLTADDEYRA
jgi:glycosyltransferase involved in cell wall biosynthesis